METDICMSIRGFKANKELVSTGFKNCTKNFEMFTKFSIQPLNYP